MKKSLFSFPAGPPENETKSPSIEGGDQDSGTPQITRREALKRAGKVVYVAPAVLIISNKSLEARGLGSPPPPPPPPGTQ